MKSLEIVNDKIAELKDTYQHYTAVEKDKVKSSFAKFDIEQFQQIKQDLEVLEIIKKHLEVYIWQNIFSKEHELEVDIILKHIDNEEEIYKVKQWLEMNENE
jgi:hypothetical protein